MGGLGATLTFASMIHFRAQPPCLLKVARARVPACFCFSSLCTLAQTRELGRVALTFVEVNALHINEGYYSWVEDLILDWKGLRMSSSRLVDKIWNWS